MVNLATNPRTLLRQLEFLGKGIEMKSFIAARQKQSTNVAVIHVSTLNGDRGPNTTEASTLIETTFSDILAQKPYSSTIPQSSEASPALHEFASPTLPKELLPSKSSFDSPEASVQPADPGSSKVLFDDHLPDLGGENTLRQQTQADILNLQKSLEEQLALLEKQEQKVRQLQEEIYMKQLSLGPAQAPAHMEVRNVFDEMLTNHNENVADSESPGAVTLVEPISDSIFEPTKEDVFDPLDALFNDDSQGLDDILMADPVDSPTVTGIKKRKRFSIFAAAKKARTNNHAHHHEITPSPHQMAIGRPVVGIGDMIRYTLHLDDDGNNNNNNPLATTRPTSWPRTRLFRRSAGVSVKKLTDVFEKLRATAG
ncbi:MAG: hypothetical protein Q9224_001806 [Gallowayella concinna]